MLRMVFKCDDELIDIPNAFSPNNDGNNDRFEIFPAPIIQEIYTFKIFNRWGALVWETDDINETWDGNYKGMPAAVGVYVYFLEV